MSEMKERITFECGGELARQIEKRWAEFNGKYTVNDCNMEKFSKVYDFFYNLADEDGGEIRCFNIHPETTHASVSIEVSLLDLNGGLMRQFIDILQCVDVFEAKSTASGGLMISASVNQVWEAVE